MFNRNVSDFLLVGEQNCFVLPFFGTSIAGCELWVVLDRFTGSNLMYAMAISPLVTPHFFNDRLPAQRLFFWACMASSSSAVMRFSLAFIVRRSSWYSASSFSSRSNSTSSPSSLLASSRAFLISICFYYSYHVSRIVTRFVLTSLHLTTSLSQKLLISLSSFS